MISENDKDDFRVVFIVFAAVNRSKIDSHFRIRVYDNKTQVELLHIKNKYYEQVGSELSEITDNIQFDIPNGWEWGKLSTVIYRVGNKNNQIQTKDILKIGYIPVVSQGQNLVDGYCNNKDKK